jgi:hypothetical protein
MGPVRVWIRDDGAGWAGVGRSTCAGGEGGRRASVSCVWEEPCRAWRRRQSVRMDVDTSSGTDRHIPFERLPQWGVGLRSAAERTPQCLEAGKTTWAERYPRRVVSVS